MTYKVETFTPFVGQNFIAHTAAGQIALKLQEAVELPRRSNLPAQFATPVSLLFSGPASIVLQQDNYYLDHAELGRNFWCMGPILSTPDLPGASPDTILYEVIFC